MFSTWGYTSTSVVGSSVSTECMQEALFIHTGCSALGRGAEQYLQYTLGQRQGEGVFGLQGSPAPPVAPHVGHVP